MPVKAMNVAWGSASRMVPGVAVEVVVVAAVGLVDDHDDVAPVGQQRVVAPGLALGSGAAELLQRREVDAAGGPVAQLVPQRVAVTAPGPGTRSAGGNG